MRKEGLDFEPSINVLHFCYCILNYMLKNAIFSQHQIKNFFQNIGNNMLFFLSQMTAKEIKNKLDHILFGLQQILTIDIFLLIPNNFFETEDREIKIGKKMFL